MSIRLYIVRRLLLLVLLLVGMTLITFIVARVVPSNPAATYVGGLARPAQIEQAEKDLGLDKPLWVQYGIYMKNLVTGDWGTSLVSKRPVISDIAHFLPISLQLIVLAMGIALVVGIPIGLLSARYKGSPVDHGARLASIVGVSFPSFGIALILQLIFCRILKVLPVAGTISVETALLHPVKNIPGMTLVDSFFTGNWTAFWDVLQHAILPALAIAAYAGGVMMRMSRSTMLETLSLDYVRMHRATGMPSSKITFKYAMKNALPPVTTVLGIEFAYALVGIFLVEIVFSYAGIGMYTVNAIMSMDYPVVLGTTIIVSVMYVVVNLMVDLAVAWMDPRVVLR